MFVPLDASRTCVFVLKITYIPHPASSMETKLRDGFVFSYLLFTLSIKTFVSTKCILKSPLKDSSNTESFSALKTILNDTKILIQYLMIQSIKSPPVPWSGGSFGWSVIAYTKRLWVGFQLGHIPRLQVRSVVRTWVNGKQLINVFVSHQYFSVSLSTPFSLCLSNQ